MKMRFLITLLPVLCASSLFSLVTLGVAELSLIKNVIPDDVRDIVTNGFDRLLHITAIFFNLRTYEFHDCVTTLLTSLQEESGRHFVDQAAQGFDLALVMFGLDSQDGFLQLVE